MRPTKPLLTEKDAEDRKMFCKRLIDKGFTLDNARGKKQRTDKLFTDEFPIELFPKPNQQNIRAGTSDPKTIQPTMT